MMRVLSATSVAFFLCSLCLSASDKRLPEYQVGKIIGWTTTGVTYGNQSTFGVHTADKFVYQLEAETVTYDFSSWSRDFETGQEVKFRLQDTKKGRKLIFLRPNAKETIYWVSGEQARNPTTSRTP
jgi:hypothetical protein